MHYSNDADEIISVPQYDFVPMGRPRLFQFLKATWQYALTSTLLAALSVALIFFEHARHNVTVGLLIVAAVGVFLWGAYIAWNKERDKVEELQSKAARPQLAFTATDSPQNRWFQLEQHDPPPLFFMNHVGGDTARYIQIEPIHSLHSEKVCIEFDQIPFLATNGKWILRFKLMILGEEQKQSGRLQSLAIVFFHHDAEKFPDRKTLDYPITIKFKWNDQWQSDTEVLRWNPQTKMLTVVPVPNFSADLQQNQTPQPLDV